jgi:ketosteroid isomerase-like protein
MEYLSEDPWPLAGALGLVALGFLVALLITQQGKHLIRAGIALGLALAVIGIEHFWVTDNERIEAVVYDLARAVGASDPGAIEAHLAPDFEAPAGAVGRAVIRASLPNIKFDFVRVSHLRVNAGAQTRLGTADFTVQTSGMGTAPILGARATFATPPSGTDWSLGFRETAPGQWKVTRITPTRLPQGMSLDALAH